MASAKSASVNVYSSPYCPYCHMAKDFLNERKVEFRDFDVSENQEHLREMMKKSGQSGVPVLEINGKIIVGFNKEAIVAALGAKK